MQEVKVQKLASLPQLSTSEVHQVAVISLCYKIKLRTSKLRTQLYIFIITTIKWTVRYKMNKLTRTSHLNFKTIIMNCFIIIMLAGCNSAASGNSSNNSPDQQTIEAALTIDNAGIIPVFSNIPTSTVIYVHNNSTTTISGISYSLANNNSNKTSSQQNTNENIDSGQCVAIAAGQSCALKITTPSLNTQQIQGSMLLKASYVFANKAKSFSQLINYALVDPKSVQTNDGVKFKSGANISGYGNTTGYTTLYLYASGNKQNYVISDITINKPSLKLNMNYNQLTLAANSVQAIEISSPIMSSSIDATITVKSNSTNNASLTTLNPQNSALQKSLSDTQFSDSASLAVEPSSAGAILVTGTVPLINTANGTSSSMLIQNAGNQDAVIGSVSAETGISGITGCSNVTLAAGDTCIINFNVTEAGGSANITIPYTGGSASSVAGNVTWFNGIGAALVSVSVADNPLSFSATLGATTQVTVTNIGGYTLNNINIPAPIVLGGHATASVITTQGSDTCTGQKLDVGSSCSYLVSVEDSFTDLNQQINLGFTASYIGSNGTASYSRIMSLIYNSTAYGAIIALSTLSNMSISGNNVESETQNLTISNNGAATATLTSIGLVDNPAYLLADNGNCGSSIAAGSSCTLTLKLGPIDNSSSTESTGIANYLVNYAAVGQTPAGMESTSVAWSVSSNAPQPPIINMVTSVTGCASGDGITTTCMDNPTATGGTAGNIQIVLTFTNSSTVTAASTISLPESSSSLFTVPGYTLASSSCVNGAATNNGSCTIVYNLPSKTSESAFQSNLNQADFAYNYTYGAYSGSGTSNLATMVDIVMPLLSISDITSFGQSKFTTATINWSNLYQSSTPTTATAATESNGTSPVTGLSSVTPASCGSVTNNSASCTSKITATLNTPAKNGYLLHATAAGEVTATPESFTVFSNQVIFVTSGTWNGNLGNYSGADSKCGMDESKPSAGSPGAGKSYKALLYLNNATSNGVKYYRTDGTTLIATATGGFLVGETNTLINSISATYKNTWTGGDQANENCATRSGAWLLSIESGLMKGNTGSSSSKTTTWAFSSSINCNLSKSLYCVAQ